MLFRVSLGSGRRSLPWMVVVVVVFVVVARMDEGERSRERIVASIGRMTNMVNDASLDCDWRRLFVGN